MVTSEKQRQPTVTQAHRKTAGQMAMLGTPRHCIFPDCHRTNRDGPMEIATFNHGLWTEIGLACEVHSSDSVSAEPSGSEGGS